VSGPDHSITKRKRENNRQTGFGIDHRPDYHLGDWNTHSPVDNGARSEYNGSSFARTYSISKFNTEGIGSYGDFCFMAIFVVCRHRRLV
jgi:hypothetical protein